MMSTSVFNGFRFNLPLEKSGSPDNLFTSPQEIYLEPCQAIL